MELYRSEELLRTAKSVDLTRNSPTENARVPPPQRATAISAADRLVRECSIAAPDAFPAGLFLPERIFCFLFLRPLLQDSACL